MRSSWRHLVVAFWHNRQGSPERALLLPLRAVVTLRVLARSGARFSQHVGYPRERQCCYRHCRPPFTDPCHLTRGISVYNHHSSFRQGIHDHARSELVSSREGRDVQVVRFMLVRTIRVSKLTRGKPTCRVRTFVLSCLLIR